MMRRYQGPAWPYEELADEQSVAHRFDDRRIVHAAGGRRLQQAARSDDDRNTVVPTDSAPNVSRQRMFIVTTREATEVVGALFSGERAPDLGRASVG